MVLETIEKNPQAVQIEFYSGLYKVHKSDSPDLSRALLIRRVAPYFSDLGNNDIVLELGSGRQIVTREYLRDRFAQPSFKIVTLDIADIARKKLLAKDKNCVTHLRADGSQLPFQDGSFALVVSSMALDFMGEEAIPEVYRVLRPGGKAEINLHHPNLIPNDLDELLKRRKITKTEKVILEYWSFLKRNHILTSNSETLRARFENYGFEVENLAEAQDDKDTWWEVSLKKNMGGGG